MKYWYFQNELERAAGGRIPMIDGYAEGDPLKLVVVGNAATLDAIYALHNRDDRPHRTVIRSMSVGDVVVIEDAANGALYGYTVEKVGWRPVPVTFAIPKLATTH